MSNSCSALATRQDLQRIQAELSEIRGEVGGKLDNSERDGLVQQASGIGAALAVATLDPRVQALLGRLASLTGTVLRLVGQVAGVFSLIASLASIAAVTVLQIRVDRLESKVEGLTNLTNEAFASSLEAAQRANAATQAANAATTEANAATALANRAAQQANQSISASNLAVTQANAAYSQSRAAQQEANSATARANQAITSVNAATAEVNTATTKANAATALANRAVSIAEAARAEANNRTSDANAATEAANRVLTEVAQLRGDNASLRSEVQRLEGQIQSQRQQNDLAVAQAALAAGRQALTTALRARSEITTTRASLEGDVEAVRQETQQERLRRERQERIDAVHRPQAELRADLQARTQDRHRSQTELQLEQQRRILDAQTNTGTRLYRETLTRVAALERQLGREQGDRQDQRVIVLGGGVSLGNPALRDSINQQISSRLGEITTVNDQQYRDILDRINNVPGLVGTTVVGGLAPTLGRIRNGVNTINTNTRPQALTQAAAAGVCQSTQPGGCMQRNVVDRLSNNIGGVINAGGTAFAAANNALLIRMQGTLNAVRGATEVIKETTQATLGIVGHARHGLEAVQNFASTAWRVTKADKIMNAVTMAVTIHNGMMLSNNLAATVSEAINMSLQALNLRDETDSPIDIGSAVRDKMASILTSILGAEQYAALTTRIAKANRIYQSSVNMLHAINDLADSARSVAEMTAEHTGKIGNALRESGAVYEDAYEEFVEKVNPQSKAMRNLEKFRGGIEGVAEGVDTITQLSSGVIEIQENWEQITEANNEWKEEVSTAITTQKEEKDTAKIENQVQTDIDSNDFAVAPSES